MGKNKIFTGTPRENRKDIVLCLIAFLIAIVFLFPIYWMAITSIKVDTDIFSKTLSFIPRAVTLDPWIEQFTDAAFLTSLRNSTLIALFSMTISLVLGIPAAYAMGKYRIPGGNIILLVFLVTQMMPASLLLTPLYLTFSRAGILNSYLAPALAVASGSIPFIVITLRPYFKTIPKSLDEAARIDGCNAFSSFIRIMIPTIKTGSITVLVISFLHGWNDLVYSMTFNVNADMRPLTANIYKFMDKYGTKWNSIMAYGAILVLPVILAFVFLQKYIVGGLTAGAVKE
ncbi:carbohydrate ABC transporter permease [Anaerobium acetethylicum]|uniref:Multiple sugar transport system permease protein n=1 Tax=Anaerobium acetethylicum TaxID=1619234 RepID=A0A1D3TW05_9FIRM|nr:carbohydrate ABC transporter permease [Anaerobium acetethylicum]SCP98388.1 multiple sugar transport system permease protein [Anaerobium acetethylicum]